MRERRDDQRPIRVLGYARVSSREQGQHGTSLEAQQDELRRFCEGRGYPAPILHVEVESGAGDKVEARREQLRLLASLRAGDLVLVSKQDRWSRDVIHYLSSADGIAALGARLTSIAEGLSVEVPEERLAVTTHAAFSEFERRRIIERTQSGRRRRRSMGQHVDGHAPLGYRIAERKLVIVPDAADAVRAMFTWCLEGKTTRQIGELVARRFPEVRGTDHAAIARRLRDRRYLGLIPTAPFRKGGRDLEVPWVPAHEPIVEASVFQRAQTALTGRRAGGRPASGDARNAHFLLRAFGRCAHCGHLLLAHAPGPDASIAHDGWYMCRYRGARCPGPLARRDRVDRRVEELLLDRLEELKDELAKPPSTPRVGPDFAAELASVERKRGRLVDAIADGALTIEAARGKLAALEEQERLAKGRHAAHQAAQRAKRPEVRVSKLADIERVQEAWGKLTPEERRAVLRIHVSRAELASTAERRWQRDAWDLRLTWTVPD